MPASKDISLLWTVYFQEVGDMFIFIRLAGLLHTRARTMFYKAAYTAAAQSVELLLYMIVLQYCMKHPEKLAELKRTDVQHVHDLQKARIGTTKDIYIAERKTRALTFEDVSKDLLNLNRFCRDHGLTKPRLHSRIERMRIKRNEIHPQLRSSTSRSYTKANVDQLATTQRELVKIYFTL